jgi:hypothetical protein
MINLDFKPPGTSHLPGAYQKITLQRVCAVGTCKKFADIVGIASTMQVTGLQGIALHMMLYSFLTPCSAMNKM